MIFWLIVAVIFWLLFGSFWSVILSRRGDATTLQQASSILWWRSECPHCKHRLHARDLVPVLSFLFQSGKCRYCHKKISWLYPILEIGAGVIFWLIYRYTRDLGVDTMLFWITTGWILWLLLVYDVLRYEVHIPLVIFGWIIVLIAASMKLFSFSILRWGLSFLLFFLLMYVGAKMLVRIMYKVDEEGIGMWDVIIAPYLWAILYAGLPRDTIIIDKAFAFVLFLLLSSSIGLIWYFVQNKIYQKKATFLSQKMADRAVPFLPAMILGVVVVIIAQKYLFNFFWF